MRTAEGSRGILEDQEEFPEGSDLKPGLDSEERKGRGCGQDSRCRQKARICPTHAWEGLGHKLRLVFSDGAHLKEGWVCLKGCG